jgi:hypothetical protein
MITHDVLFACASPDDVEERGSITRERAIDLFRTFPFAAELEARSRDPNLTVPTITFTDQSSDDALAIWSETAGRFVIWFPPASAVAENVADTDAVEECIGLFFDGRIEELARLMSDLGPAGNPE